MIRALGHRIQALHIHDNDRWHDYHQIPFSMNIDFGAIVKALQEIHYEGYFTLEADAFLKDYHTSDVFDGVVKLKESAKKLADYLKKNNLHPEQVQDFYPTPSTAATVMFYTGIDPFTSKPVYVATTSAQKQAQRALLGANPGKRGTKNAIRVAKRRK